MTSFRDLKPNFFIVGAPKCGTTAWAHYLSAHPAIYFPKSKEPHFFNSDQPGFRWARSEEEYVAYFDTHAGQSVVCDASVQYLFSVDAAHNISAFNPKSRILIMLRKPSSFIRSYHNQLLLNLDENITDLRVAWELSGKRNKENAPPENREIKLLDYKKVGLFSEQVTRYFDVFDRSQIFITFMEDWIKDPRSLYVDLMNFLELDDNGKSDFPKIHSAKHVSNRTLHRLTQRPPKALKMLTRLIRRFPGMRDVKPSRALREINAKSGYNSEVYDPELIKDIDAYFTADQVRLHNMLELPR